MRILIATVISCASLSSGLCDEPADCSHRPIVVRSRPVIERLPLNVIDPVDAAITDFGATIVAERQAGIVFLLTENGKSNVLGDEFEGLQRITDSDLTGIHALCTRDSSSTIYRLTDSGFTSEFTELNFAATGLAAGGAGQVWTSNPQTGQVMSVDPEGRIRTVATLEELIIDIAADEQGAYVLCDSGRILSVAADGSLLKVGHVSKQATRIQVRANHQIVALVPSSGRFGQLQEPTLQVGAGRQVGKVPHGTQTFAYDCLDNITLGNPDLRALTRVTSHFQVPCPHCGKPVSMTLSTDGPQKSARQRSF